MRTYTDLVPAFPGQDDWALPTALRHHAARRPDAVLLDLPEEGVTFTYGEALAQAESVADRLAEAGAEPGDRVLVMAANSSQFLRTWLGTGIGGTVEVRARHVVNATGVWVDHLQGLEEPGRPAVVQPSKGVHLVVPRDRLLDNLMLYWLPRTGASAARLYWESIREVRTWISGDVTDTVAVPAGCAVFPKELQRPSLRWAERRFTDIRHWSEPPRGGHSAALEQPETYAEELRAFFRLVR